MISLKKTFYFDNNHIDITLIRNVLLNNFNT